MSQQSFDPLAYLSLNIDDSIKKDVGDELLNIISQYFIIRFIELLPEDNVKSVSSVEEIFALAQKKIPDFNSKVKEILADFKDEYQQQVGIK